MSMSFYEIVDILIFVFFLSGIILSEKIIKRQLQKDFM